MAALQAKAKTAEALIFKRLREDVPSPKQQAFFTADAPHVGYGGSRGGGKSWAGRRKMVTLAMEFSDLKLLLLRRTMPELRENHIRPLQFELNNYAKYKAEERAFDFPNGSRLKLGYCDNEGDLLQYQGQEFDVILFEEATNFPEDWIVFISTCLRTTRTDFTPRAYYTMNPGGVGHAYMKRIFIDKVYKNDENPADYVFIRAGAGDNPHIDPNYVKRLKALPPHKRRAHLDGDWNVYEGQVFEEFVDDPAHYDDRIRSHVINPFEIPPSWNIYRSFDFGYARPFSVGWWAVDCDGRLYRILEYYGCQEGGANTGLRLTPDEIFAEIARVEREHRWFRGKRIYGIADPSIWDASRGESVAETAERRRVYFDPGDNTRLAGWLQVHHRLQFDQNGIPMMYIFANCRAFIRTIPLLRFDPVRPEDVDTRQEDHVADEVRYMCMSRPIKSKPATVYNPLSENIRFGGYNYIK
ncbi:phage terminase large subunit [Clostridia bacterium]|nr:phage terminase large subunit [Clostridia bacterium]